MSSNEYTKVKETLELLIRLAAEHYAIEINAAIYNMQQAKSESPEKYGYFAVLTTQLYSEFTDIVETIYPGNRRKLEDWIQTVDEMVDGRPLKGSEADD